MRTRLGPSISSVQGGLSASVALREVRFGGFNVVARFILFRSTKGNDVHVAVPISVDEHHDFTVQHAKRHVAALAVPFADILARDGEIVPDRLGTREVELVAAKIWRVASTRARSA
jgi:hypothetical protein